MHVYNNTQPSSAAVVVSRSLRLRTAHQGFDQLNPPWVGILRLNAWLFSLRSPLCSKALPFPLKLKARRIALQLTSAQEPKRSEVTSTVSMAATHALRRCPDAFSVARCTPKHGRALHKHLCTATVVAPRAASTASLRRVVVQAKRDPEVQVDQAVKGGLVNPAFAAVLSEALSRGGADELGGAESSVEAERAA